MVTDSCDIFISGGGIAGLTAAAAFGSAGFHVIVVDPSAPITDVATEGADLRTTAIMQPARRLLMRSGLWERLAPFATDLQVMAIMDLAAKDAHAPETRAFDAKDVSQEPFGWNLPNWLLNREMAAHLATLDTVDFRPGIATVSMLARDAGAHIALSDGVSVTARLVVAADGRESRLRGSQGIGVRTWRYGQKALAFAVTHPIPHQNVSTEIHRTGGPFTLVPLPDHDGRPASGVVWMERAKTAVALAEMPGSDFEDAMSERSNFVLGPLSLASSRTVWPIISQLADRFDGQRLALIAEAAHVVPPIGAQGLNMSLADIAALLDLSLANPAALGTPAMLREYHRSRYPETRARVLGVDLLNRASMAQMVPVQALRARASRMLHEVTPLRHLAMHMGMGHGQMLRRPNR
ncbi:MAG: UbiH/UbiF family hydroxylase [Pseudomonadota bacterium]